MSVLMIFRFVSTDTFAYLHDRFTTYTHLLTTPKWTSALSTRCYLTYSLDGLGHYLLLELAIPHVPLLTQPNLFVTVIAEDICGTRRLWDDFT